MVYLPLKATDERAARKREQGRARSAKFYEAHKEDLQRASYMRCIQKGLVKTSRPSTVQKYGLKPRIEIDFEIEVF